jgi:hypothetical protein
MIQDGLQTFADALKRTKYGNLKYSSVWQQAWLRVAGHNVEHLDRIARVAKTESFVEAACKFDKLSLAGSIDYGEPIRVEIALLVVSRGGSLQSKRERQILKDRRKIAEAAKMLSALIAKDPELAGSLRGRKFYALAFKPLGYHLRDAPGAPNLSTREAEDTPILEKILGGLADRIEAREPFGMIQAPQPTAPRRHGSGAQQTQFEQVLLDLVRRLFGAPNLGMCALFASAAFGRKIDAEELRQRDVSRSNKKRQLQIKSAT